MESARLDELRVRRLILEDSAGSDRVAVEVEDGGTISFVIFNSEGASILLEVDRETAAMTLVGGEGAAVTLIAGDRPMIRLMQDKQILVSLETSDVAGAAMTVNGPDGSSIQLAAASPQYGPCLGVFDSGGASRLTLGVRDNGQPFLGLTDEDEMPRALLGMSDEGDIGMALLDEGGDTIAALP